MKWQQLGQHIASERHAYHAVTFDRVMFMLSFDYITDDGQSYALSIGVYVDDLDVGGDSKEGLPANLTNEQLDEMARAMLPGVIEKGHATLAGLLKNWQVFTEEIARL